MSKPQFVYVTYIRTTPEKLWAALTDPEFIRKYWFGVKADCDWKEGSAWSITLPDGRLADTGQILEAIPRKRLVIDDWQNQFMPELKAEGTARCTFEIEPLDGAVKLTVTHVAHGDGDKLIKAVSGGWPRILSNLKSLLETGQVTMETKV